MALFHALGSLCLASSVLYSNMLALVGPEQRAWRVISRDGVRIDHADRFRLAIDTRLTRIDLRLRLSSGENEITVAIFEQVGNLPAEEPIWSALLLSGMTDSPGGSIVAVPVAGSPTLSANTDYWIGLMASDGGTVEWYANRAGDRDWHAERNNGDLGWFRIGPPWGRGTFPPKGQFRIIGEPSDP